MCQGTRIALGNRRGENLCPQGSEILLWGAGDKQVDTFKHIVSHEEVGAMG